MRYATRSLIQTALLFMAVSLVLMIVFAIEKIDYLIGVAVRYDIALGGFLVMFASLLPAEADFIIPVATVIAVYVLVLVKRENRELLILASAGGGIRPLLAIVTAIAAAVFAVSVIVSGYVQPFATGTYRAAFAKAVAGAVSDGPRPGRFMTDGAKVLYVSAQRASGERNLRVFQFDGPRLDRLFISDCSNLIIREGALLTNVCAMGIYAFRPDPGVAATLGGGSSQRADCRVCPDAEDRLDVQRLRAGRSSVFFNLDSLVEESLSRHRRGRVLHELLAGSNGRFDSRSSAARAAEMLLLAAAAILAAAFGVVAAALTNPRTRFFALPVAIGLSAAAAVVAGSGALIPRSVLVPLPFTGFIIAAIAACAMALPMGLWTAGARLLAPGLART